MTLSTDLKNVLTDATVIADQDEQQQVRMNKQIHNHRVASIELLAAAIDVVPELQVCSFTILMLGYRYNQFSTGKRGVEESYNPNFL